jgi:hypothetical protein
MLWRLLRGSGGRDIVYMHVPQGILYSRGVFSVICFYVKNAVYPNDDIVYSCRIELYIGSHLLLQILITTAELYNYL